MQNNKVSVRKAIQMRGVAERRISKILADLTVKTGFYISAIDFEIVHTKSESGNAVETELNPYIFFKQ